MVKSSTKRWGVKIADFGLSTTIQPGQTSVAVNQGRGTDSHMAPEALQRLLTLTATVLVEYVGGACLFVTRGIEQLEQGSYW
ncbi:hypothetical protein WJX74_009981 [Apatococcus lobatus]|uniref:Protein kinase domain-containing protein n=1 Tax=Apatococcus lobatus TaxID=904363 RepID=A0AAW1QXT1_9CHLO